MNQWWITNKVPEITYDVWSLWNTIRATVWQLPQNCWVIQMRETDTMLTWAAEILDHNQEPTNTYYICIHSHPNKQGLMIMVGWNATHKLSMWSCSMICVALFHHQSDFCSLICHEEDLFLLTEWHTWFLGSSLPVTHYRIDTNTCIYWKLVQQTLI